MGHGRTIATVLFIAGVAAVGIYFAQRKTVARGDVMADTLVEASPKLDRLDCDKEIPIGVAGATFDCRAFFKDGNQANYTFKLDRNMHFEVVSERPLSE